MAENPSPETGGTAPGAARATNDTTLFNTGHVASHSGSGNQTVLLVPPRSKSRMRVAAPVVLVLLVALAVAALSYDWNDPEGPPVIRDFRNHLGMSPGGDPALITLEVPSTRTRVTLSLDVHDATSASNCVPGTRLRANGSLGNQLEVRKAASGFTVSLPPASGTVTVTVAVENEDRGCSLNLSAKVA
ncbi:hypothetical protein [Streptomyces sp. CBMA156]|uniref:hypothetical protein n=1 Tax=Streptomyces sp. CBMA156 TaxID=1930280 RepID=UPI0016621718|nr:hypothetical protein [Streptomyces sp. CBMA156]MBD0673106.1 hypothetical protein [Streptomyces sp. CBMA156]